MKQFILLILILFSFNDVFAYESVFVPEIKDKSLSQSNSAISSDEYEELEKKIFKKTFKNENSLKRLARLEKEIFGMEQKGNEKERFENLLTASDYYSSSNLNYKQAEDITPQYYTYEDSTKNYRQEDFAKSYNDENPPQKVSKIKQFMNNVAETFSDGYVTGYTPPVNYGYYNPIVYSNSSYPIVNRRYNSYVRPYYKSPQYMRHNNYHYPKYNHNFPTRRIYNNRMGVKVIN